MAARNVSILIYNFYMKSFNQLTYLLISIGLALLTGCSNSDSPATQCLPNQFPFEEGSFVTASYNSKNNLVGLSYTFESAEDRFQSVRSYDSKNRVIQINFYVNGYISDDFVRISYSETKVKEDYFRSLSTNDGLMSTRYYYFDENEKIVSYSDRFKEDLFVRSDSVVFSYTNDNVTGIIVYNGDDIVEETYTLTFDSNTSPYYKSGFAGDEYLYSYLNLSLNNPLTITHVEADETTTFTYTYSDNKGFPLTRLLSTELTTGEFKYTCDNP